MYRICPCCGVCLDPNELCDCGGLYADNKNTVSQNATPKDGARSQSTNQHYAAAIIAHYREIINANIAAYQEGSLL